MTPAQAAALGLVQGVAEVVPVSSSAQLALLPDLLGWAPPPHRTAFAAALHTGSTVGIAWALRHELRDLPPAAAAGLLASCLPAAAAGLLVDDAVERRLGGPRPTAALLGAAGALLLLADRRPARRGVGRTEAVLAAAAQVLALAPGVSRSGAVLTALRARGVDREAAARHALLMSLPVTAGASLLPLARADRGVLRELAPLLAAGVPTAALSGATAVTVRRRRPGRSATAAAVYRLGLAAAVLARRPAH